jgi:nucleotide-binding universal stress UspA family protein
MSVPQRILVGLDFGQASEATLDTAVTLSKRLGCKLLLTHAVEYVPHCYGTDFSEEKEVVAHVNEHLAACVGKAVGEGAQASALPAEVGRPQSLLLSSAESAGVDAIVIGVSNRSALERLLVGATAEKVVRTSHWPVFLRHPDDVTHNFESLLCAVDFSDHAERTLKNAVALARALGAVLHVLHVEQEPILYPGMPHIPLYEVSLPQVGIDAAQQLAEFVDRVDTSGVVLQQHIRTGVPASEIIAAAMELEPGLLVVGKHGHGGFIDRLLGGVATHILRNVPCSLLVIGERDFVQDE